MTEKVELRIHGAPEEQTLIYLPGTHGDWTLVGGFRRALGDQVQFAEISYPRTLTWSLEDHAIAIETALRERGITAGWLLGESFGSQVGWALVARQKFAVKGVVLAGGFVRHPTPWAVRLAAGLFGIIPLAWLKFVLAFYARAARIRYRRSPEVQLEMREFISRRGLELDRQAARHRLDLIAEANLCEVAQRVSAPVYVMAGFFDPIVPWFWVRRWLRRNCAQLREYRIIAGADHNVLGTAPETAAKLVLRWMTA